MTAGFSNRVGGDLGHSAWGGLGVWVGTRLWWIGDWVEVGGEEVDIARLDSSIGHLDCGGKEGGYHFILSTKNKYNSNCGCICAHFWDWLHNDKFTHQKKKNFRWAMKSSFLAWKTQSLGTILQNWGGCFGRQTSWDMTGLWASGAGTALQSSWAPGYSVCVRLHRCSLNVNDYYVLRDWTLIHSFSTYCTERALC